MKLSQLIKSATNFDLRKALKVLMKFDGIEHEFIDEVITYNPKNLQSFYSFSKKYIQPRQQDRFKKELEEEFSTQI